jgi:hypothetical protein
VIMAGVGGGYSQSKSQSDSATTGKQPWKDIRSQTARAEKRFLEPLLTGNYAAPAVQDAFNFAKGASEQALNPAINELSKMQPGPQRAQMVASLPDKIAQAAAGATVASIQDLQKWFAALTDPFGTIASSKSSSMSAEVQAKAGPKNERFF